MKSGVFIRNSYLSESWGQEERELSFFPFSSGEYFEVGSSHVFFTSLHFTSHFSCTQCCNILGIKYHILWWCVTVCWLDYDLVDFFAVVHSLFRFWSCVSPISSRWQWTVHTCLSLGIGCRTWAASTSWRSWETWSSLMWNCGESAKKPVPQTLLCSGYQCYISLATVTQTTGRLNFRSS